MDYKDKVIKLLMSKELTEEQKSKLLDIFPELKEGEDERIRKALRKRIIRYDPNNEILIKEEGISQRQFLAWLEKQEQHKKFRDSIQVGDKVTRNEDGALVNLSQLNRVAKKDEKQGEQKPVEFDDTNAKQMFIKALERVEEQNNKGYKLTDCDKNSWWEDFKTYCSYTEMQKPVFEMKTPEESLGIDSDTYNKIVDECIYGEQKPADKVEPKFKVGDKVRNKKSNRLFLVHHVTKEGFLSLCDIDETVFQGYLSKDNFDNYELVEQNPAWSADDLPEFESYLCLMFQKFRTKGMCTNGEIIDYVKEHSQKLRDILVKPAWSKEDDEHLERILKELESQYKKPINRPYLDKIESDYNWLKSLKDRVQPKQQEWSEEDEARFESCIKVLQTSDGYDTINTKWLKSLRPQSTWKPSDEQMTVLNEVINYAANSELQHWSNFIYTLLKSLREQLKKLMEE